METSLFSLKKNIEIIQTTKLSWVIEIKNELVDLKTVPGGIMEELMKGKNKIWEECEERVNCFLEEKLDIDTSDI